MMSDTSATKPFPQTKLAQTILCSGILQQLSTVGTEHLLTAQEVNPQEVHEYGLLDHLFQ